MKINKNSLIQAIIAHYIEQSYPNNFILNNAESVEVIADAIVSGLSTIFSGVKAENKTSNFYIENAIPACHVMDYLVIKNTTSNNIVLDIGTTESGNDIADNVEIIGNSYVIVDNPILYSEDTATSVCISSSNWNNASIDISVNTMKVI